MYSCAEGGEDTPRCTAIVLAVAVLFVFVLGDGLHGRRVRGHGRGTGDEWVGSGSAARFGRSRWPFRWRALQLSWLCASLFGRWGASATHQKRSKKTGRRARLVSRRISGSPSKWTPGEPPRRNRWPPHRRCCRCRCGSAALCKSKLTLEQLRFKRTR